MSSPGESSIYPRVYHASVGWTVVLTVGVFLATVTGGDILWRMISGKIAHQGFLWLVALPMLAGWLVLAWMLQIRAVLRGDEIELSSWGSKHALKRDEIRGWRRAVGARGPGYIVFLPKNKGAPQLGFPGWLNLDATFWDWVGDLPNLPEA